MAASEDRILHLLKSRGPQSTAVIARQLEMSIPGARKHLAAMAASDLVTSEVAPAGVGRPKRMWRLTKTADTQFPDTHDFLTVELIDTTRRVFGRRGLDRLIEAREQAMRRRYRAALAGARGLAAKVAALASLRSGEGYMAEWTRLDDGSFLLAENHCPICAAARACQGFCRSELELFKAVLGKRVTVERQDHILAGARRCAYRIAAP